MNPVIDGGDISFKGNKTIRIYSNQKDINFYYTTDGSSPTVSSKQYTGSITIDTSTIVKAITVNSKGETSYISTAMYKKALHNWSVKLNTAIEAQFEGGGAAGLIDDIHGSTNWAKGNWQGYQKADMDAVIDLQQVKTISKVTAGFLQDTRSWIVIPKQLIIEVSTDGKQFIKVFSGENFLPVEDIKVQVKDIEAPFAPVSARYVRVRAIQYGKLPAWHESAGSDTHIFVDEINIK